MNTRKYVIVALDVFSVKDAECLIIQLKESVFAFKFGLQFITSCGVDSIMQLMHKYNIKVFYDAKFNDIPNTVEKASMAISQKNVWMFDIHANCGSEAIKRAAENKGNSKLIAITVMTSLSDKMSLQLFGSETKEKCIQLATLAYRNGADGVVCSPYEIKLLRQNPITSKLLLIVPGIRPKWANQNDQARYLTPLEAINYGADFLVIGRPITSPPDSIGSPAEAIAKINTELEVL